jgi:hypothetical protein
VLFAPRARIFCSVSMLRSCAYCAFASAQRRLRRRCLTHVSLPGMAPRSPRARVFCSASTPILDRCWTLLSTQPPAVQCFTTVFGQTPPSCASVSQVTSSPPMSRARVFCAANRAVFASPGHPTPAERVLLHCPRAHAELCPHDLRRDTVTARHVTLSQRVCGSPRPAASCASARSLLMPSHSRSLAFFCGVDPA